MNLQWNFYGNKMFIHPPLRGELLVGIRYRSSISADELVSNQHIKHLTLAEAKIILGTIRATFGGSIPGGAEMIQLRAAELIAEGKEEKIDKKKELQTLEEPLFLTWG